jgi:elongation factor P
MLGINDLEKGSSVIMDGDPFSVLEISHQHVGRGGSSIQTKLKNLRTGQVLSRNFKPADEFEEAEVEELKSKYLYAGKGEYWFAEVANPSKRFSLNEETIGDQKDFLKPDMELVALIFNDKIFAVRLPIKIEYIVTEAPPAVKGNTAQGGTKVVVIESGAKVNVPMFIGEGDIIRVNTQTGEYGERVEKGK